MAFFYPCGLYTNNFLAFPACFRGLEQPIDDFKHCTPFAFVLLIEKVNPAFPELVLKGPVA